MIVALDGGRGDVGRRRDQSGGAPAAAAGKYFLRFTGTSKRKDWETDTQLNRDKIESLLIVPGRKGRHENALIKSFKTCLHLMVWVTTPLMPLD